MPQGVKPDETRLLAGENGPELQELIGFGCGQVLLWRTWSLIRFGFGRSG
jgi:hypothetical protein